MKYIIISLCLIMGLGSVSYAQSKAERQAEERRKQEAEQASEARKRKDDALKAELKAYKKNLEAFKRLKEKKEEYEVMVDTLETSIGLLDGQKRRQESSVSSLRRQNETELKDKERTLEKLDEQTEELQDRKREKESQIASLADKNPELKAQRASSTGYVYRVLVGSTSPITSMTPVDGPLGDRLELITTDEGANALLLGYFSSEEDANAFRVNLQSVTTWWNMCVVAFDKGQPVQ